jgi:hypothetical protein
MALEDYPFRVEELTPAGKMIRCLNIRDGGTQAEAAGRAPVN